MHLDHVVHSELAGEAEDTCLAVNPISTLRIATFIVENDVLVEWMDERKG
jgi:hypothetical protein